MDIHPGTEQQGAPGRGLQPAQSTPSAKMCHWPKTKHGKFQCEGNEPEKDTSTSEGRQAGIAAGAQPPFQKLLPIIASANN